MIPRILIEVDADLPAEATFWTPDPEDLGEDGEEGGIAYFRDTWMVYPGTDVELTQEAIRLEAELLSLINRHAQDSGEFDAIAGALEYNDPSSLPSRLDGPPHEELHEIISDDLSPIGGLEIGVSGLAHALSSAGCWPAASCRGHPEGSRAWSTYPVVYFAAARDRCLTLQPLVSEARCGFMIDPERPKLLCIAAASVEHTARLAALVVDMP